MSYTRDGDRRTRGVGAVAAADNVSMARRRRQAQIHQITRQRDRAMADIAQGALGRVPIGPGGAVRVSEPVDTTNYNPVRPSPPRATQPPMAIIPIISPPVLAPPSVVTGPAPTIPPPLTSKPPTPYPVVISPPAGGGGGGGGGGDSGSGVVLGPGTAPPIVSTPLTPLPDVPSPEGGGPDTRTLAIAGGVALAAYLLFFRRKS